jgi:hypothetical protein
MARALVRVTARSAKVVKRSWSGKNGAGRRVGKRGVIGSNKVKGLLGNVQFDVTLRGAWGLYPQP